MAKQILGLDLGTNSIGWALLEDDANSKKIIAANSRILPIDQEMLGKFETGDSVSNTAQRTQQRGARRLRERFLLRRERLLRVLHHMGFLPAHYADKLDRYGKFIDESEPKIAWANDGVGRNEFIFTDSFLEMTAEFRSKHGEIKVPHDWTLYYLRSKATAEAITKEELAWVLLSFIQKRGYNPTVGLDEDESEADTSNKKTREAFIRGKVKSITDTGTTYKENKILIVELEDGSRGKLFKREIPDWVGQEKYVIATYQIDKDGNDKYDENLKCTDCKFTIPSDSEWDEKWALLKKRTEQELIESGLTLGSYIYKALLTDPTQKIKGKLVRVVDRKFYEDELHAILRKQAEFHPELSDRDLYAEAINLLYQSNEAYRASIASRDFEYLIADDIIMYQRPLKVKKSLIANCQYERTTDTKGTEYGVKCIARSHPLFEEFRLWQWIANLRVLTIEDDEDVTNQFIPDEEAKAKLFEALQDREAISMKDFLQKELELKSKAAAQYRWNYVEDKSYPCCNTRAKIIKGLAKAGVAEPISSQTVEALWQILYSVSQMRELKKAMATFCTKHYPTLNADEFARVMARIPAFVKDYGSYSYKAIKRLIALMRCGHLWSEDAIDATTKERIAKISAGEADDTIHERAYQAAHEYGLTDISMYRGLPLHVACYIVYGRHSEAQDISRWVSPTQINDYLKEFKQHSLHNPIVEQVTTETLKLVRDIWQKYGKIDEFHIELGRELNQTSQQRKNTSRRNLDNEAANRRARALLYEFAAPDLGIEGVRPYSPTQIEIFRIFEDGILSDPEMEKDIEDIKDIIKKYNNANSAKWPTHAEVKKYALWLEQRYQSPYTGRIIPLTKLFTSAYQIEHIIPKARYFDDSYANKVVCEADVNQLKDSQLGHEFIVNCGGQKMQSGGTIFKVEEYENFVKKTYASNKEKLKRLMADDITDDFNDRKLNDTRYISRMVSILLSKIVRAEDEDAEISKNVIAVNGSITSILKRDWGMNDVWNSLLLPRFERLNRMKGLPVGGGNSYVAISDQGHHIPQIPIDSTIQKKRLDHRHHAMDAIVIACTTRNHVSLISNMSANTKANDMQSYIEGNNKAAQKLHTSRYDLQIALREHTQYTDEDGRKRNAFGKFFKPWPTFTEDAKAILHDALVSFKYSNRILTKTTNHYQRFKDGKRIIDKQEGDLRAIRNSMHKDTVFGRVNLRQIADKSVKNAINDLANVADKKVRQTIADMVSKGCKAKDIEAAVGKKVKMYVFSDSGTPCFATRKPLDTSFDRARILDKVTAQSIQKILLAHLDAYAGDPKQAFSPDGIEEMNRNITELNGGTPHKPIFRVRCYEQSASKFAIGSRGNKKAKFVEGDKGSNAYFAIYADCNGKRTYRTITLSAAIERLHQKLSAVPTEMDGASLLFYLQPCDLVYLPTETERTNGIDWSKIDHSRIYKFVSCNEGESHFIPASSAAIIEKGYEYEAKNKMAKAITGEMIKEHCVKISINRIGEINHD